MSVLAAGVVAVVCLCVRVPNALCVEVVFLHVYGSRCVCGVACQLQQSSR